MACGSPSGSSVGLDEGSSEPTDDGWVVRFERQLTRPIDEVAAALVGDHPAIMRDERLPDVVSLSYEWNERGETGSAGGGGGAQMARSVDVTIRQGTGHGARLVAVERGPASRDDLRVAALASWKAGIESLAAELAERNRKAAADN